MHNMNVNGQWQPQARSYSFQSSTVTYGGHDGNYYTSSKTTRTGSDGVSCACVKSVRLCLSTKTGLIVNAVNS